MGLTTEYHGYQISFGENDEKWGCYDIGFHHVSLARVKRRIDDIHLKLRKASSVDCLVMGYDDGKFHEGKIVEYLDVVRSQHPGTFERVHTGPVIDHKIAVVSTLSGDRPSRREFNLSCVFAPEAAEMLPAILAQKKIIKDAQKEINRIRDQMPRVSFDKLVGLVEAGTHVFSEGEAQK